jgi:hypothetical protein
MKINSLPCTFILLPLLLSSCNKNADQKNVLTDQHSHQTKLPESWQNPFLNSSCGPDDGAMTQLRFGWHKQEDGNLEPEYPYLIIDYRQQEKQSLTIFGAQYCSDKGDENCEYVNYDAVFLEIKPEQTGKGFYGNYTLKLASGKSMRGDFNLDNDQPLPGEMHCP